MSEAVWPLLYNRPRIQISLIPADGGGSESRDLVADTGAGTILSTFDMLLKEQDCQSFGEAPSKSVTLGGAYSGVFSVYLIRIQIPTLGFDSKVKAVGITNPPVGFDGLASFRFLNQFTYGNFGDPNQFGLEN